MTKGKIFKRIAVLALVLLILIQFFKIDKTNPKDNPATNFIPALNPPTKVADILIPACYDCHSHRTKYPWYTNTQPAAWFVKGHIKEGRRHLNFSEWTTYSDKKKAHKIEEMIEVVEGKEMPMLSYMIAHKEAWINEEQRKVLVDWLKTL